MRSRASMSERRPEIEMKTVIALLLGILLGQLSVAAPAVDANESTPQQVAYGTGSVFGTLVYSPVKASFCILSGVAGAFTAIGSPSTAGKLVGAGCRGTWEITPDVLKGREQVKFVGDTTR